MEKEDIASELSCILPDDTMVEILSRLSVKSLLKFSCVNKSWYNLVKNPGFIKMHSLKVENDSVVVLDIKNSNLKVESKLLLFRPGSSEPEDLGVLEPSEITIVGSSNGLVCLTYMDQRFGIDFKVMNPALKEHHRHVYKKSGQLHGYAGPARSMSVGFGFDMKSGDFKILRVEQVAQPSGRCHSEVNLYSLSSNSWKTIQSSRNMVFKSSICPATIGSCLYWLSSSSINGKYAITCFDLSTEMFHEIPLPESRNLDCVQIFSGKEFLTVFFRKHENYDYDMWTISPEQISVTNGSWKVKKIPDFDAMSPTIRIHGLWIHGLLAYRDPKKENYLLRWEESNTFPKFKIVECVKSCRYCFYRESLVSITDALKRKPVGAREKFKVCKVLGIILLFMFMLCVVYFFFV